MAGYDLTDDEITVDETAEKVLLENPGMTIDQIIAAVAVAAPAVPLVTIASRAGKLRRMRSIVPAQNLLDKDGNKQKLFWSGDAPIRRIVPQEVWTKEAIGKRLVSWVLPGMALAD